MKDKWYGDNRDLVKWGVLVELANQHGVSKIVQVAYYRPEARPEIEIDGSEYPIPDAVAGHFPRDVMDIDRLSRSSRVHIKVLNSTFSNRRDTYMKEVQAALGELASPDLPCIIFLDPDKGLERKKPSLEHVLKSELKQVWEAMRGNDLLVFYQHKPHENNWIELRRGQFAKALDLPIEAAKIAHSKAATDVVFFFVKKLPSDSAPK